MQMNRIRGHGKRVLLAALLATAAAANAHAGSFADLRIINRATGEVVPTYAHRGRLYIAGNPGERYAIQVINRTGARVLTVVSVDGINVVTGETANPQQSGYVLAPYQSHDIAGWRKSANEVAAFYFTSLGDSYAARTDRPDHVGVIGLALFREGSPPRPAVLPAPAPFRNEAPRAATEKSAGAPSAPAPEESEAASAPSAGASADAARAPGSVIRPRADRIGTGHGEREHSEVTYTQFRRADAQPNEVLTLYYDSRENLVARGIIPGSPWAGHPAPFPGVRFVPDPRG